jgi:prefoldin subunit 5
MNEEQLNAEIARLESQQKALENDWHALRGAIAAFRQMLAAVQKPAHDEETVEASNED